MRNQRNALLAGIAALALMVGTGIASAQETSGTQNGSKMHHGQGSAQSTSQGETGAKMGKTAQHQGMQGQGKMGNTAQGQGKHGKMGKTAQDKTAQDQGMQGKQGQGMQEQGMHGQGKMGKTAQEQGHHRAKGGEHMGKSAEVNRGKERRTAQTEGRHHGKMTKGQESNKGSTTAQREGRNGTLKGLQGNATAQSGSNVKLTESQRTTIRNTVIDSRSAPRVSHVNFSVRVGTVIPRGGVRIVPVPETLVRIYPAWRGLRYFVYEQEIVIVDPSDYKIVAVLPV